jgi:hypothetical protein
MVSYYSNGGGLEIRTLAGHLTHYRFSRPTPSTAWVILHWWTIKDLNLKPVGYGPNALTVELMVLPMVAEEGVEPPTYRV